MRRILVLSFLGLGLALFRSPGFRPPQPDLPVDSSLHVIGSLEFADSNHHLYVRGRRLTGKVTATWRNGTSIANYTSGGMLLASNKDADRYIAQIALLEQAEWQLDRVRDLVSAGILTCFDMAS